MDNITPSTSPGFPPVEPGPPTPPAAENTPGSPPTALPTGRPDLASHPYQFGPYTPPPYQNYGPPPGYFSQPPGQLAGFGSRFVAMLIDSVLVSIPSAIFYGLLSLLSFGWLSNSRSWPPDPGWSVSIIAWGLYAWFCYSYLNGNTLGKKVLGLKLVNPDGSKPDMATFILHYTLGYFINGLIFGLGFLWVLFDPNRQTWGQKLFKDSTVTGTWEQVVL